MHSLHHLPPVQGTSPRMACMAPVYATFQTQTQIPLLALCLQPDCLSPRSAMTRPSMKSSISTPRNLRRSHFILNLCHTWDLPPTASLWVPIVDLLTRARTILETPKTEEMWTRRHWHPYNEQDLHVPGDPSQSSRMLQAQLSTPSTTLPYHGECPAKIPIFGPSMHTSPQRLTATERSSLVRCGQKLKSPLELRNCLRSSSQKA